MSAPAVDVTDRKAMTDLIAAASVHVQPIGEIGSGTARDEFHLALQLLAGSGRASALRFAASHLLKAADILEGKP